jgi:putative OPT family oligopeptide transporter
VEGAIATPVGTFYGGSGTSPALVAVGAIVGLEIALVVFLGGAVNWLLVLPFVAQGAPDQAPLDAVWTAWSTKTRYLGVGAMTVGGMATLFEVRQSIVLAVRAGLSALSDKPAESALMPREERDLPARVIFSGLLLSLVPLYFVFDALLGDALISAFLAVLVLIFGFLFSSVAAYMAGLVGSSNNPVSGVTIATILFASLLLSMLGVTAVLPEGGAAAGPAAAILVGSVVCTAAAIGGDNVQDLRAGYLLRATPYRQQIMQLVGVLVAALVLGPVLQLLLDGFGFGPPTAEHPDALRAPQATLMASVAEGVFGGNLPWPFLFGGAAIGAAIVGLDRFLAFKKAKFRVPVLAFALGLYLPWELSGPILLGGALSHVAKKKNPDPASQRAGLLAGAGLITGEALMGIVLAGLFGVLGSLDSLKWGGRVESGFLSVAIVLGAAWFLWSALSKAPPSTNS